MTAQDRAPLYVSQREMLHELVAALVSRAPDSLEAAFRADWKAAADDGARLRVVVDQVASLTDVSAQAWHRTLVLGAPRAVDSSAPPE
jgi:dGTPase